MNIPVTIKELFVELEQMKLCGRQVSRLLFDMRSGKVEMEFYGNEDDEQSGQRLERYEHNEAKKIEGWTAEFVKWERKHHGRIGDQDYQERVVKELQLLLDSTFLVPEEDLLNAKKLQAAIELLDKWHIGHEHDLKFALLCELVEYSDGFFSFENTEAIEDYLEDNHHQLCAKAIDAMLRFKTMMCLCWERTHKKEDFAALSYSRKKILSEILHLIEKGDWNAPTSVEGIGLMMKKVLGAVPCVLSSEDTVLSAALWKLFEQGKGDRVKVTMQNLIGYFISRKILPDGSPAQNKRFFGDDEGYSNIDKGINANEMSNGFKAVLPLLDKYLPL